MCSMGRRCSRYGSSRCSGCSGKMVVSFLVCVKPGLAGALVGRKLSHRMATLLITKHSEGKKLVGVLLLGSLATSWGSLSFTIGSEGS